MFAADTKFQKQMIWLNSLVPAFVLLYDWKEKNLGANPVEVVLRSTGVLTLIFLAFTLLVTPLKKFFKLNWTLKHRRALGLFAFFYGCLHLATYVIFDRELKFRAIVPDILKRPFIAVGMLSFLLMVPLALTSTNNSIRRLGAKRWRRLHQLTYLISVGGVIHYYMIVKSDLSYPLMFGGIILLLLAARLPFKSLKRPPQSSMNSP